MSSTETAEDILNDRNQSQPQPQQSAETQHTAPTAEEIARDIIVLDAPYMMGGRRDGSMFCEVRRLTDGYAYRLINSKSDEDWRWLRTADFRRDFFALEVVNMTTIEEAFSELSEENRQWRKRFKNAIKAMGKKSRSRIGRKLASLIGD